MLIDLGTGNSDKYYSQLLEKAVKEDPSYLIMHVWTNDMTHDSNLLNNV